MSLLAFFLLLIACVNFVNLATARSMQRAREVGMRKALGAVRGQLVGQFLSEAFLQVGIAIVVGIGFAELLRPYFQDITGWDVTVIGALKCPSCCSRPTTIPGATPTSSANSVTTFSE